MADKKVRKSLDDLRGDIQELAESFAEFRDQVATTQAGAAAERQKRGSATSATTKALEAKALSDKATGYISASGFFDATEGSGSSRQYRWSMEQAPIQEVLAVPVEHFTQKLAAIGHAQRLGILLRLLNQPSTANDVVEGLALGTTGAAYHHLNVLQAAGLVEQQIRGTFTIVPGQVPVLLTILATLADHIAVDVSHSSEPTATAHDEDTPTGKKKKA